MSIGGDLYTVPGVDHRTPGNKREPWPRACAKPAQQESGHRLSLSSPGDFVERAVLDEIEFQYLYADGEGLPLHE